MNFMISTLFYFEYVSELVVHLNAFSNLLIDLNAFVNWN
jgi:hypothetical protein